jgi:hypothetical protein
MAARATAMIGALAGLVVMAIPAAAQEGSGQPRSLPVAVLGALDKITGRVSELPVPVGDRTDFFRLRIDVMSCQERVAAQQLEQAAFLIITETPLEGEPTRVFSGWMFASSPSVSAMDHPIYDVWLVRCEDTAAAG